MQTNDTSILRLMTNIKNGHIQIPSIQREWIWDDEKICDIISSVISGYPIGAVLFLNCEDEPIFECKPVQGVLLQKAISPKNLILDGQQRLTAIYGVLYNIDRPIELKKGKNFEERYYYLDIALAVKDISDSDAIISVPKDKKIKNTSKNKNAGLDLSTTEKEFKNKMFPLNIILEHEKRSKWADEYKEYYRKNNDEEIYGKIKEEFTKFDKIFNALQSYTIPVISLGADTEIEAICKIFEKVNSSNKPLTGFNLLNAIYAKKKFNLYDDWDKLKKEFFSKGILKETDPQNFLRACKLFVCFKNGNSRFKKNVIIDLEFEDYEKYRTIVAKGFDEARKLLEEEGIFIKNLPYSTQLIPLSVICALLIENNNSIATSDNTRQKVKQWYWCGVFNKFYENGANDTKFFNDIKNVMNWINDGAEPELVKNFDFDWTKLKNITSNFGALYYGIIALIIKNNCKDFASGRIIKDLCQRGDTPVEVHHIFPKASYQKKYGDSVEIVVNKTPLSKKTNDILGGISPSHYLINIMTGDDSGDRKKSKNKAKRNATELVSPENLESYLKSHWIDVEALENEKFEEFICSRTIKILSAIESATGKSFLKPGYEEVKQYFFDK